MTHANPNRSAGRRRRYVRQLCRGSTVTGLGEWEAKQIKKAASKRTDRELLIRKQLRKGGYKIEAMSTDAG